MKKYFIRDTEVEVKIGDVMEVNFIRINDDYEENELFTMESVLTAQDLSDYAKEGILEEFTDNDESEEDPDFVEDDVYKELIKANGQLEERVTDLEKDLKNTKKALNALIQGSKEYNCKKANNSLKNE